MISWEKKSKEEIKLIFLRNVIVSNQFIFIYASPTTVLHLKAKLIYGRGCRFSRHQYSSVLSVEDLKTKRFANTTAIISVSSFIQTSEGVLSSKNFH